MDGLSHRAAANVQNISYLKALASSVLVKVVGVGAGWESVPTFFGCATCFPSDCRNGSERWKTHLLHPRLILELKFCLNIWDPSGPKRPRSKTTGQKMVQLVNH